MVKVKGRILSLIIVLSMIIGSFGAFGTYSTGNDGIQNLGYVPGEVIVGFHTGSISVNSVDVRNIESFEGYDIKERIEVLNAAVIEVNAGEEQTVIDSISNSQYVKYAELNWIVYATFIPDDPQWDAQWGPQRIHCAEAWDTHQGSSSVKIAICDTGIDHTHDDLADNYVSGGWDWINNDDDPMDDNDHGTHCAGIAAAVMDNDEGIAGVAQVSVMAEKVLSSGGSGSATAVANGITHAADNGADVISLSLSSTQPSTTIENACDYAYNTKGVVIVAAAGNDDSYGVNWPARFDTVIAIGSIDNDDQRSSFSNYGTGLELVAPGRRIISTIIGDDYDFFSGTSMSTPHVAGVAALAKSQHPTWTNVQIRDELKDTAEDLGPSGWDDDFGYGLVDARLSGGTPDDGAYVSVEIHQVKGLDEIDPWPGVEPEWFYKVSVDDQSRFEYDGYEEPFFFWYRFIWNKRNLWTPDKTYSFFTENSEVDIEIKLMDDDLFSSDIADLSERPSDDFWGGEEGRIFTITYDLFDDDFTGDRADWDGTWYYTRGDWDGSTDPEGILDPKQDDAQLWFKITDNYNPDDYNPDLYVNPTSINFGSVKEGEVVTADITIKNNAKKDDPFRPIQDLNWNIDAPSWVSVSPTSGSLEPKEEKVVSIEIDTQGMQHKTWSGTIEVTSNGGDQDISIVLTVPRSKTRFINLQNLLQIIQYRLLQNLN